MGKPMSIPIFPCCSWKNHDKSLWNPLVLMGFSSLFPAQKRPSFPSRAILPRWSLEHLPSTHMARSASAPMEVFLSRDRLENLVMVDWMLIMVMILMFMVHMVMFFLLGIWLLFKIFFKGDSEQLQAVFFGDRAIGFSWVEASIFQSCCGVLWSIRFEVSIVMWDMWVMCVFVANLDWWCLYSNCPVHWFRWNQCSLHVENRIAVRLCCAQCQGLWCHVFRGVFEQLTGEGKAPTKSRTDRRSSVDSIGWLQNFLMVDCWFMLILVNITYTVYIYIL